MGVTSRVVGFKTEVWNFVLERQALSVCINRTIKMHIPIAIHSHCATAPLYIYISYGLSFGTTWTLPFYLFYRHLPTICIRFTRYYYSYHLRHYFLTILIVFSHTISYKRPDLISWSPQTLHYNSRVTAELFCLYFVGTRLGFFGSTLIVKCQHHWLPPKACVSIKPSVCILGSWIVWRNFLLFSILKCFGWLHFGMFSSRGWSLHFLVLPFIFLFFSLGVSTNPQRMYWDIQVHVWMSLTTPQHEHIQTQTALLQCHSFGPTLSIALNHVPMGPQLSATITPGWNSGWSFRHSMVFLGISDDIAQYC
jgi:hypothetical protein